ncbi:MAG: aspartate dehydrogenase [Candidatus Omnitrophota bacterium]
MKTKPKKIKIGIIGCGAIGSRIALSLNKELKDQYQLAGIYDIDAKKARTLAQKISRPRIIKETLSELIQSCDLVVEAINAPQTQDIIRKAVLAKRHVLAMSVGKLLNAKRLFDLAKRKGCHILLPSGALAGIDAIKAVSLVPLQHITLTTRKPPAGLSNNPHILRQGIDLTKITDEKIVFDGDVKTAVKFFPQNINVAATLALASQAKNKIRIRIITSPRYTTNSHEVEVSGAFGKLITRTENIACPDNPKTSYLAVLSAIQTLKQFNDSIKIGT